MTKRSMQTIQSNISSSPVVRLLLLICIVVAIALLAGSCARNTYETLRIVSELPTGTIDRTAPLQFTFSRRVASPDSLNQWTDAPYIQFEPPIPGKFMWHDTAQLVFVPDALPKGDTKFSATLNTALLVAQAGAKAFGGQDHFSFSTEHFLMKSAEFFYDRIGENHVIGIRANLNFNYDVNPADVAKYLTATVDNIPQPRVVVVSTRTAGVIAVEIGAITQTDKPKVIAVMLDKQLVSPETNTPISMDKPFSFTLPPVDELRINGHASGYDGGTGWITISTSQDIDTTNARAFIQLDPAIPYALEPGGNSITIRGRFSPGTQVHLVIKKGFESFLHGKTQNDYEAYILFGNIEPVLRYASERGMYMLLGGQKALEVKSMNMPKIHYRIAQIFRNNLTFFLSSASGGYNYYGGGEEESEGEYSESGGEYHYVPQRYVVGNYGRYIYDDTLRPATTLNREVISSIDMSRFMTPEHRGIYLVEIANPGESWKTQAKLVSISDLGLICKRSDDQVLVFVTNLTTAQPDPGVIVKLISTSNQVIAQATTDADGAARFDKYQAKAGDFTLGVITAEQGNDMNFLSLNNNRIDVSRFDVGGKRDTRLQYDAMVYGDRNLYRPGEKIILAGVVRQLHTPPPKGLPVKLRITNPRGTLVSDQQLTLNDEGGFETAFQTGFSSASGSYEVSLSTGNDVFLASNTVSVEDFVPDRMRVDLRTSRADAGPGDTIRYDLTALNFFGPPAGHRTCEFEGTFFHLPYISKNFREFSFSDDAARKFEAPPTVLKGETNEKGQEKFFFVLPEEITSFGVLRARAKVAVFDETGRPVYQIAQTTIYPKNYFIGVRNLGEYYLKPNTSQTLRIVAVDRQDKPINGFRATVSLFRYEWHSVLREAGNGSFRFVSERQPVPVSANTITLSRTPTDYKYSVPRSGEYVLRVSKEGDTGYNEIGFYAYAWGTTNDLTSFGVDPEARVNIVMNESTYAPGSRAHILFQTPFSGNMLVTVERNGVYRYTFLNVVDNTATMDLPIEEEYLPNVYVTATLFRKIQDNDLPLLAGHGFAPIFVEKPSNKLNIAIVAPPKIRPRTHQTITVAINGAPGANITLAAVDEGICQVKNYRTPDPFAWFYQRKALETESYDFFRDLLPEPSAKKSSPGGSDETVAKRVNPLGVKRFKPVALWSGIVRTGTDGKVSIPFDIPDFNGELRLMAFAYKGDRFGSAEQAMTVADPIVLSPALPRFASPGDSLIMPVTAFNTTDKPAKLQFQISVSGPMQSMQRAVTLDVPPNQERYVDVPLRTTNDVGKATVKISTTAFGEPLESVTELPVRPIAAYASNAIIGFVEQGKPATIPVPSNYLPGSRKSYLTMSPFPAANFAKQLKHLVGYPYGCLEQTVSKAFPQIYLRDIALLLDPSIINRGSPAYFVNEAVGKVVSMQMPDGAFTYWPGGSYSEPWATVYATHFLLEAKKAGYAVPEATLSRALSSLTPLARSRKTVDYYFYGPGNKISTIRIADKNILYALYVLALAGKADKPAMDFYRAEKALVTRDGLYLLSAAYNYAGEKRASLELLPKQFSPELPRRQMDEDFDSPIRANALILNTLVETDLDNPDVPVCLDYLSKAYRENSWYSTQDDAFTLLALGKMARNARKSTAQGTITVGKKKIAYPGGDKRFDFDAFGNTVSIALSGTGRAYYSLVMEGISTESAIKSEDRHLHVRREMFDRNGAPVNPLAVKRNDLIIVRLTFSADNPISYLAISDLLPAGLEIENPRLTDQSHYAFIKEPSEPSYTDIRDDRINFFFDHLDQNTRKVYYLCRAVSAGTFRHAPVIGEAMYDGNYYSASGQGTLRVIK